MTAGTVNKHKIKDYDLHERSLFISKKWEYRSSARFRKF